MNTEQLARILQLLSNPKRLQILFLLKEKEQNVKSIEEQIDLSQSALSQHLALLRKFDIVQTKRVAQNIFYSIKDQKVLSILELLSKL